MGKDVSSALLEVGHMWREDRGRPQMTQNPYTSTTSSIDDVKAQTSSWGSDEVQAWAQECAKLSSQEAFIFSDLVPDGHTLSSYVSDAIAVNSGSGAEKPLADKLNMFEPDFHTRLGRLNLRKVLFALACFKMPGSLVQAEHTSGDA